MTNPRPLPKKGIRLLGAGISQGVLGFVPLPAVAAEIESVGEIFPSVLMIDETFTRGALEKALAEQPYNIVHLASHGEFNSDPSDSFLLTWDGRLYMEKFSEIVSQTRFREDSPLELLTLSACETAVGDDRAALGMAGAGMRSGARSVVATLWSVNDKASEQLMARFYKEISKPGVSRARAMQTAQRELIGGSLSRHPGYWSPFLLISSWL